MTYIPVGAQNEVITTTASVSVVLGGAGTGKTITAAAAAAAHLRARDRAREQQRRKLITDGNAIALPPKARVLFLSFSRTAVAQVIDRASRVVGPLLDWIEVVTFDGFAWRIINDWGAWYGYPPPLRILSEAECKVPGAPPGIRYAHLIPAALTILANPAVCSHYDRRYSLLICDEFQDTDDEEFRFLTAIAPAARRILLGDVNQCIYAEMKGIDPETRIAQALALPGAVRIDLPAASHRDPSGVLPAAADAARERRFDDNAVIHAVRAGRLVVNRVTDSRRYDRIVELVKAERVNRRGVSIFTHSNASTSELSDALTAANVRHEQVGLSEAYGEALNAQIAMLRYALEGSPGRRALAVFVAANHRTNTPLVGQIMEASNPEFERALSAVIRDLHAAADPLDVGRLASVIASAYGRLGTHRGQQAWSEAGRRTRAAMRLLAAGEPLDAVEDEREGVRHRALLGDAGLRSSPVQVMNLHQTKGREADTTILLLQSDEYHGNERPPYPRLSRLLYVVLTRARDRAYIVVPDDVHPLWRPLIEACETTAGTAVADA
jgi:DNA helicase II / ATP-dependent DNA helicase PcrA